MKVYANVQTREFRQVSIDKYEGKYWQPTLFRNICKDKYVYTFIDKYRQE